MKACSGFRIVQVDPDVAILVGDNGEVIGAVSGPALASVLRAASCA